MAHFRDSLVPLRLSAFCNSRHIIPKMHRMDSPVSQINQEVYMNYSKFWFMFTLLFIPYSIAFSIGPETTVTWEESAEKAYDLGFMHMLMRAPNGGVCLFNMDIVENDSPGSGISEKGVSTDRIWGENRARKIFYIDDPRTEKAWLVLLNNRQGKIPLHFAVNGRESQFDDWTTTAYYKMFLWTEFPSDWLKRGRNVVDIYCPDAHTPEEGWDINLSRADEFESGGGNPADVGKTSYKSSDGGKTWKESPFGPDGRTRAEYSARISLDRFVQKGWLETPVIDLWKGNRKDFITHMHTLKKLTIDIHSLVPHETNVEFFIRKGTSPSPYSNEWEPYSPVGSGADFHFMAEADFNRRYIQIRAVLTSGNPLSSPVIKNFRITAVHQEVYPIPSYPNIRVIAMENSPVAYSSLPWEWEQDDRPEFKELRLRENLDTVVAGCINEFSAQVKLLDYATRRWRWVSPFPEYPTWDAFSILRHINMNGGGGMCGQYNLFLAGLCMAYGWQARMVNIDGHEVCEVWNDDYGKWIYIDASGLNHYLYDAESVQPLSLLDVHERYLDTFNKGATIDWTSGETGKKNITDVTTTSVRIGSLTDLQVTNIIGLCNGSHIRLVPRTNWFGKPTPRPLNHGASLWPWNGYVNWYDSRTPPKRPYSHFTDRPRDIWPDLNTVHIHATQGLGPDRLFLEFETYTPNFSHFEIDQNDSGWKKTSSQWTWFLQSGRNILRVRSVNKLGVSGKHSRVEINYGDTPLRHHPATEVLK